MSNIKILFFATLLLIANAGMAQPKENSPYSRFGIGDLVDNNLAYLRGTGLGAALYNPYQVNIVNPASNGFLKSTVFDVGLYSKYSNLKTKGQNADVFSGNIDYLSFGVPLINSVNELLEQKIRPYDFGLSFTLMPHSNVGFDIISENYNEEYGTVKRSYKGKGGTYKFLAGFGARYKDISLGINLGYFFGKINYDRLLNFSDLKGPFVNNYHQDYSVSGFLYNVGAIYNLVLNKKDLSEESNVKPKKLIFGVYGNSKTNFSTVSSTLNTATVYDVNSSISLKPVDTLVNDVEIKGKGTLPVNIGGGIVYNSENKWIVGLNYSQSLWSQYTNDIKNDVFSDSYDVSLGVQYTPNEDSYLRYFDRVSYRGGLYYKTDPRNEGENQFDERGFHVGLGLPFIYKRMVSRMNIDLNFGNRGSNLAIRENFVKLSFSVTFNDSNWFIKRKYY